MTNEEYGMKNEDVFETSLFTSLYVAGAGEGAAPLWPSC